MRTKTLQDLAHDLSDRMPEVAATGLEHVRHGGRIVAERAPVALGEGVNRLTDLADRAGVPVPARLEALGRKRGSLLSSRRRLVGIAVGIALLALAKVVRARRSAAVQGEADVATPDAGEDRNSMPPNTRVAGPRSGEATDAKAPGSRGR